jgi:hypothetical protein
VADPRLAQQAAPVSWQPCSEASGYRSAKHVPRDVDVEKPWDSRFTNRSVRRGATGFYAPWTEKPRRRLQDGLDGFFRQPALQEQL